MKYLLLLFLSFASVSFAQQPCPNCGQIHAQQATTSGTRDVVGLLNRQRAMRGLPPYQRDPVLQRVAERRAVLTGRTGRFHGHPAGSFSPARMEGVGYSSGLNPTAVVACGTYETRFTRVGAAMYQRNGRSFFACVYR